MLTNMMYRLLILVSLFGVFSSALREFFSLLLPNLPTVPFIVMEASSVFVVAFLFGPKHGVLVRWRMHNSRAHRTKRENTLKSIFHVLEARDFHGEGVTLEELAARRRETIEEARQQCEQLRAHRQATLNDDGQT